MFIWLAALPFLSEQRRGNCCASSSQRVFSSFLRQLPGQISDLYFLPLPQWFWFLSSPDAAGAPQPGLAALPALIVLLWAELRLCLCASSPFRGSVMEPPFSGGAVWEQPCVLALLPSLLENKQILLALLNKHKRDHVLCGLCFFPSASR